MEHRSDTCSLMEVQALTSCHKRTNLSLSVFLGDPTEAKGIICKEVTVGSKTVPTTFFVVDVNRCYNVLLGQD
jgi:hypothetical protein